MLLPIAALSSIGLAQATTDFAGDWVLKVGNRIFMLVTLRPAPEAGGSLTGSLLRPEHLSMGNGALFSGIKGPVVHYPIVRSNAKGNCLRFTVQNPADKTDQNDFQLCLAEDGRGSLKIDILGVDPWPVSKEKGPLAPATDWDSTRTYFLDDTGVSSSEMQRIYEEDQKDRQAGITNLDRALLARADAARREATRKLLADGNLHTGEDFERAAFVFQHGDTPDDYLLAHTLAMVAVARGQSAAIWIGAATLDRYLNSIHQPQVYGTQFYFKPSEPTTQEPYNRGLISDALRRDLGVPSQATQEDQRRQYEAERTQH
jgi:hypothetical protein